MYDIIVIGAGSGGLNVAVFMNKAGFKVLLVEKAEHKIGGDCLNYGCIPSKALIHTAKLISKEKKAEEFGVKQKGKVNIKKVMNYIKEKKNIIRVYENSKYFKEMGIDVKLGIAKFVDKNQIRIGSESYKGKKIVIATGSSPRKPNIKDIDKMPVYTNETIFDIKKIPKNFVFIGGGPISLEIGQCFQRFGSNVTIIEKGEKFLPKENKTISDILHLYLKNEGMKFIFNNTVKQLKKGKAVLKKKEIKADAIFIGAGRIPNTDLDLVKANIELEEGHIKVDKYLRTTNKNVYAIGDVIGQLQFTHAAELHAKIVINNLFNPIKKKISYDDFGWVTYTEPEVATFGKLEGSKLEMDFHEDDRAIVDNYRGKLLLYHDKEKINGATMICKNAGELIQELILAKSSGLTLKDIFNKNYPYPTASRINKNIVSKYYSKKLNSFTKKILKWLY